MKIDSIELSGFKRLALNNVKFFHMDLTSRVQLILGTNGSGKSSLLEELSPLPAVAANYRKDGYKKVTVTHEGNTYVLTSTFTSKQEHSIVKNGVEELNKGGTGSVQKELVWQIFGLTQERHNLIVGLEKFSEMSPSRRREWFTQLCETNYDYALKVYDRFKVYLRDTTGAVKRDSKRLVVETAKLVPPEVVCGIEAEINSLVQEISVLYNERIIPQKSSATLAQERTRHEDSIRNLHTKLFSLKSLFGNKLIFTPDEYRAEIDDGRHELTRLSTQNNLLIAEYNELKETYDAFIQSGALGLAQQEQTLVELQAKKAEYQSKLRLGIVFENVTEALVMLSGHREGLTDVLEKLPENADALYSSHALNAAKTTQIALREKIAQISKRLGEKEHQKLHFDKLKAGDPTHCPKCNHAWFPGYLPKTYDELVVQITKGTEALEAHQKELSVVEQTIADNESYGTLFKHYLWIVRKTPTLQPFWDFLDHEDLIAKAPRHALRQIEYMYQDIETMVHIADTDRRISSTQDLIQVAKQASQVDVAKLQNRLSKVEEELGHLANLTRIKTLQVKEHTSDLARLEELLRLDEQIRHCAQLLKAGLDEQIKTLRYEIIDACLKQLQIELAQKQNLLNEISMQQGIIADIKTNLALLSEEEEALKLLVSALSPTDGLIAEGLLGFIRSFVAKMNVIIRSVWTYKMEVQDCRMESEQSTELDYRFALAGQNPDDLVPDVSKGSTAQKQVVDLAFKIVSMKSLHLENNQLFLDEFASNMDPGHRVAATQLVKNLLDQLPFSQLVMVSHDFAQYGALPNPQMCVLCARNIVVPEVYNLHVQMH